MEKEPGPLSEQERKEIAERRAAALKRVQEMHKKANGEQQGGNAGKPPKPAPARGRSFRHQGR
ncbi:MAG TPA: hypothetical protein VII49_08150 [Rhizomicrobium sp.]